MITAKGRREADYYLSLDPFERARVTEVDYEEWFLWDSRGVPCRQENPIYCAKAHYGMMPQALRDWRSDRYGWVGGIYVLDAPVRLLVEAFGEEDVRNWVEALFYLWGRK